MEMIEIHYNQKTTEIIQADEVVSGQRGSMEIQFVLSPEWDEYPIRSASFVSSAASRLCPLDEENRAKIPAAVIRAGVRSFTVSVFGVRETESGQYERYNGKPAAFRVEIGGRVPGEGCEEEATAYEQLLIRVIGLDEAVAEMRSALDSKLDANQDPSNAGRALVVGEDGIVRPGDVSGSVEVDATLTEAGKAADAAVVGQKFAEQSKAKVNLPTNADGTPNHGTAGYYAVSDGEGGIKWVASGNTGGGTDGPVTPTTHGVVWNLVNVTSSNPITSVSHGASFVAVLTADTGYTLGDVTVTMGGETLTGVWNADTSTITIASVTGDVIISCAGVEESTESADTSPVIAQENMAINKNSGADTAKDGLCITKKYEYSWDINALKSHVQYDAANDYMMTAGYQGGLKIYTPSTDYVANGGDISSGTQWGALEGMRISADGAFVGGYALGIQNSTEKSYQTANKNSTFLNATAIGFEFTLSMADIENSYAYWYKPYTTAILPEGVEAGDIIFAGKNTAYYGMKNIDGTPATASTELSFDDDVAQDYSIATTSMLGEDPLPGADVYAGVSDAFAAVINTAKKEWMTEYGGDYRKIPLIVSTDHHGRLTSGVFNLLGRILNMHDVSKICDLGDTVTETWVDADIEHPLLSCTELEEWQKCIEKIPFSKRLSVFGNHDAGTASGIPDNNAHLDQYFRNIYARRTNNNGWFAVKDDRWNVKYVVVTGLENIGGNHGNISTAQMKWIISELSADDGYDVVIVSHIPLKWTTETGGVSRVSDLDTDALFAARKTKGTGTITDSEGVSHTYDFSGCDTELLCSIHGHTHANQYLYLGDSLLVNAFEWFPGERFFMVLVDRVNRQLNIWEIDNTPTYVNYQIPLDKPAT